MQSQKADYLAFGSMFISPTKPSAARCSAQAVQQAHNFGLPVVAIGGIKQDNTAQIVQSGADMLVVISGGFGAAVSAQRIHAYQRLFLLQHRANLSLRLPNIEATQET